MMTGSRVNALIMPVFAKHISIVETNRGFLVATSELTYIGKYLIRREDGDQPGCSEKVYHNMHNDCIWSSYKCSYPNSKM